MHTYIYIQGWKLADLHCKMRITYGVITNHWPTDSPYFLITANHLDDCKSLFKWISQKTF